jgi:hypothetical protein
MDWERNRERGITHTHTHRGAVVVEKVEEESRVGAKKDLEGGGPQIESALVDLARLQYKRVYVCIYMCARVCVCA